MSEHDRTDDGYIAKHLPGGVKPRVPFEEMVPHVDREGRREPDFQPVANAVPDRLEQMFLRQVLLQRVGRSLDPPAMQGEERGWYATWNHTALVKELGEALDEIAWKPWSVDKDTFNRKQYLAELVDAFHFLMNMVLVAAGAAYTNETTAAEIASEFFEEYLKKSEINMERFKSGTYDAKATKCPDCGRAIEDGKRELDADQWDGGYFMLGFKCPCGRLNRIREDYRGATAS